MLDLSRVLISISQLGDQGFQLIFSKDKCEVLDEGKYTAMCDTRLSDNCYRWDPYLDQVVCNLYKSCDTELWHKRLRHISLPSICKSLSDEVVLGISSIKT